jgi:hypothetical protein
VNIEDGKMTPREEVYAGITTAYLHRCTSVGSAFFAEILTQPKPGSIAESSLKDKDLLEPLLMAGMYLQVALDHYQTVQSAFIPAQVPPGAPAPRLRIYSPYTMVRGALEGDAWACWLLDPSVDHIERLARAMTVRAANLREVYRLGLTDDKGKAVDYDERADNVAAVADRHNLEKKWNDQNELVWVGAPPTDMTRLLDELLPERSPATNGETLGWHTYGVLSARAHGDLWAVLHNAKRAGSMGPHVGIAEVVIDVVELMRLLNIALRLHSEAMRRAGVLDGRAPDDWEIQRGLTAESKLAASGLAPY